MKRLSFAIPFVLSNTLVGCSDELPTPRTPDPQPPSTVAISFAQAPALLAFQDGFDAEWKAVTPKSATAAEIVVNGPYSVSAVCDSADGTRIWRASRTPDDDLALTVPCEAAPVRHMVTGHMVNAGSVSLGSETDQSNQADWDFHLLVPDGTYDLVAVDAAGTKVVTSPITVKGDLPLTAPVDVTAGRAFAGLALTVDNAHKNKDGDVDETLLAALDIAPAKGLPTRVYVGPLGAAKTMPASALAPGEAQTITVIGQRGLGTRSLQRPLPLESKDDATFTLPSSIASAAWSLDDNRLTVALPNLPKLDVLAVSATGTSKAGKATTQEFSISTNYIDATQLARPILENKLPGFKPEWNFDTSKPYTREAHTELDEDGVVSSTAVSEKVDPAASK